MSELVNVSNNIINTFKSALVELRSSAGRRDCEKWIQLCNKHIGILTSNLRICSNIGQKMHIYNCLGHLKGFRTQMKALHYRGRGIQSSSELKNKKTNIIWENLKSAFQSRIKTAVIINMKHVDIKAFMEDAMNIFKLRTDKILRNYEMIKLNTVFCGEFIKQIAEGDILEYKYFNTKNFVLQYTSNIEKEFNRNITEPIKVKLEDFQERESGWALKSIINLTVNINKYEPFRGSSYIPLPTEIAARKACINIKNNDNACFAWAITSALYPAASHSDRTSSYPHYTTVLNLKGIKFPIDFKDVKKFEKLNNLSINIFMLKKKFGQLVVEPTILTKNKNELHVNLLVIQEYYEEEGKSHGSGEYEINNSVNSNIQENFHFCWIKDLSKLVSKQLSKHTAKKHICDRCLCYFGDVQKLRFHEEDCSKINNCKITLPSEENNILKFKNFNHKESVPYMVYSDIEALLLPINATVEQGEEEEGPYQRHKAFSIGYYFKCSYDDTLSYYKSYCGLDCAKWFAKELLQIVEDVEPTYWTEIPMDALTGNQRKDFVEATHCHICEEKFVDNDGDLHKVRDHDHFTGKFRGAAHNHCNLNYRRTTYIPVVFHNMSHYDAHFIIKDIVTTIPGEISILPENKEKYISFTKYIRGSYIKLRFIDSFRFMPSSLDKLSSYLDDCKLVRKMYPNEEQYNLLRCKGIFPYDYLDDWRKLDETSLPPKSAFYNKLNKTEISDCDYQHAQNVWEVFNISNMNEYSELYLKTDILLLADVFEAFRTCCFKAYGLDPAHYVTAPSYSWDAMLKLTKIELELITNPDIYLFIEKGIRGGLCMCSKRYAEGNNKYMNDFDQSKPSNYIIYFDAVNLYGWAMSKYLPYGGFKWVANIDEFDVLTVGDEDPVGYILEVDIKYPESLHKKHNDLPMLPEHDIPPGSKLPKLITSLWNKSKYVIHYRNLKQCLKAGLILTKIHRILQFNQSAWLKSYIDLNTDMRRKAKNDFERTQYKNANNATFGKTMENVRERRDVKLLTKWEGRYGAKNLIAKPNFHSCSIFSRKLVAVEMKKTEVLLNKPIYVGMSILDISKTNIYDFHYNFMQKKYDNLNLLYTDTDSLIYEVFCSDIYSDVRENLSFFDTSNYSKENVYNIPQANSKVLGLMKDECGGKIITEFIGLRAKMYSINITNSEQIRKAKGVKLNTLNREITFQNYVECLRKSSIIFRTQASIISKLHKVYSVKQKKVALSASDDKRIICDDGVKTNAWGYKK